MAVVLEASAAGVLFGVKAQAGSRKNGIRGEHDGCLRVSVTQAPEKGKANTAIIEVLCRALGLRKSQLALVAGETNSRKKFCAGDIDAEELRKRITAALSQA